MMLTLRDCQLPAKRGAMAVTPSLAPTKNKKTINMINKIKILICFCSVLFCSSCTSSNSVLKDSRDGQVYEVKEMKDGNIWMTQNLNYISSGSWCFREDCIFRSI
jgi:hypothetical protein